MGSLHIIPLPAFLSSVSSLRFFRLPCPFDLFPAPIPSPALSSVAQAGCFSPSHKAEGRGEKPWALHSQAWLALSSPGLAASEQILVLTWVPLSFWKLLSGLKMGEVRRQQGEMGSRGGCPLETKIGRAAVRKHDVSP